MKAQLILLVLLISIMSSKTFATDTDPKLAVRKTQKSKYNFNIFKFYSIAIGQELSDSLKVNIRAIPPKRKEK